MRKSETPLLDQAKALISEFVQEEFNDTPEFEDLGEINILFTYTTDVDIPVYVFVDLEHCSLSRYLDDRLVDKREYSSLSDLITNELEHLNFEDLICFDDDILKDVLLRFLGISEAPVNEPANAVDMKDTEPGFVTEYCANCETEIEMRWDVEALGYKAFCPVCRERLMLCDACQHPGGGPCTGNCDYSSMTDSCRHNRKEDS